MLVPLNRCKKPVSKDQGKKANWYTWYILLQNSDIFSAIVELVGTILFYVSWIIQEKQWSAK